MVAVIPLVFAIVAVLVYALSANGKVQQLALFTYGAAMTALMISVASHTFRFLR